MERTMIPCPTSGDKAAMVTALVARHESRIRAIIARRSGPQVLRWTTVDDLFQETVAAALAGSHSFVFVGDGAFLAWIGVIASRMVARSLQDRERHVLPWRIVVNEERGGLAETEVFADVAPGPSTRFARSERTQAIRDAIDALPERYRKVLILYKLEERPLAEVAREMGCTKGATARLIARALKQLGTRLRGL